MKKLIWLECLVSKQGFLLSAALYPFFCLMVVLDNSINMLYFLPSMLASVVLVRSVINMDKYDMDKVYILLPIKISKVINAKYLFHNIVLLMFTVIISTTYIVIQFFGGYNNFSLSSALINLGVGFIIVNSALLGYYFLGSANTQAFIVGGLLVVVCFLKQFMLIPTTMYLSVIIVLIAIGISIIFYLCTYIYIVANAVGRINIKKNLHSFH